MIRDYLQHAKELGVSLAVIQSQMAKLVENSTLLLPITSSPWLWVGCEYNGLYHIKLYLTWPERQTFLINQKQQITIFSERWPRDKKPRVASGNERELGSVTEWILPTPEWVWKRSWPPAQRTPWFQLETLSRKPIELSHNSWVYFMSWQMGVGLPLFLYTIN